jgi:iron-sulfur cluster assembly accessory protein
MIELSQAAANEIRRLQHSRLLPKSYFRISVKPGGCSQLYYTLELQEHPQSGDRSYTCQGVKILVAADSEPYIENLKLDYAEDLMGGGFRFQNPKATHTCSCGLSFTSTEV